MKPQYLIRFDDICPTMNWAMWSRIEEALQNFSITPILAVVPDNQDEKLMVAPPSPDFWAKVRRWQAKGWTIGLHGYQHLYLNRESGILGFPRKSEFAGVSPEQQEYRLRKALGIFRREGVIPEVWIAPAHSFDESTITALCRLGIGAISDGFALAPHVDPNCMFWIPQQLWKFRWRPFGVWTVCYHHNLWSEQQFERFCRDIRRYLALISSFEAVKQAYKSRERDVVDRLYSKAHRGFLTTKHRLGLA